MKEMQLSPIGVKNAIESLNNNTAYNTLSFSTLSDLKTFLNGLAVGKTSTIILSGEASSAVCGSTYICSGKVSKIENDFADISWVRGNSAVGSTRYQKTTQTFFVNDLNNKLPNVPLIGKVLYANTIAPSASTPIVINDIGKYNIFTALISSSSTGGPAIGIRFSATQIRFFGRSKSGSSLAESFVVMNFSGDSFTGFDANTVWGSDASGIMSIRGIA